MELKAVRNDPRLILDHLSCELCVLGRLAEADPLILSSLRHYTDRHDDTSKNWYFLMDFDLEYTDWTGVTKILPRTMPAKNALVRPNVPWQFGCFTNGLFSSGQFAKPRGKADPALYIVGSRLKGITSDETDI